jgi:hypothetical protein
MNHKFDDDENVENVKNNNYNNNNNNDFDFNFDGENGEVFYDDKLYNDDIFVNIDDHHKIDSSNALSKHTNKHICTVIFKLQDYDEHVAKKKIEKNALFLNNKKNNIIINNNYNNDNIINNDMNDNYDIDDDNNNDNYNIDNNNNNDNYNIDNNNKNIIDNNSNKNIKKVKMFSSSFFSFSKKIKE